MNTFESILMRWMKLEPIIQSEISQKEKNNTVINAYIYIYMCVCVCVWDLERCY